MDYNSANLVNYEPAYDMQRRPLWTYNKSIGIYKCPSDLSAIMNLSGTTVPRILSMAMNLYVGGFAPYSGGGPGSSRGWAFAQLYPVFSKTTDFVKPGPAKTFIFIDMRPDSINWSNFMQDMAGYSPSIPTQWRLGDMPGMYHNRGATVSFADGHTEIKRWVDDRTTPPMASNGELSPEVGITSGNQDVYWLQDHSTALK